MYTRMFQRMHGHENVPHGNVLVKMCLSPVVKY